MTTNSEWLRSLEPAEFKAWFESEHISESESAYQSNVSEKPGASLSDLYGIWSEHDEPCEDKPTSVQDVYDEYAPRLQGSQIADLDDLDTVEIIEAYKAICQCANVSTEWKPIFAAGAVIGTMVGAQKLIAELTANLNRANEDLERARAELTAGRHVETCENIREKFGYKRLFVCSECGVTVDPDCEINYCPWCGREVVDNADK